MLDAASAAQTESGSITVAAEDEEPPDDEVPALSDVDELDVVDVPDELLEVPVGAAVHAV